MALTELQEMQELVTNLFKDAHGFKPRSIWSEEQWADMAHLQQLVDSLSKTCDENAALDAAREAKAVEKFESTLSTLIASGAGDRPTALRWLMGADNEDLDGLRWSFGLPWGYELGVA